MYIILKTLFFKIQLSVKQIVNQVKQIVNKVINQIYLRNIL